MGPAIGRTVVLAALLVSAAGHAIHNLAEFPPAILLGWETLVPLGVTVLLGAGLVYRPGLGPSAAATGWALVVIVFGGGSVLPFGFLPFVPDQSLSHYLAHVVYVLAQLPLLWVGYRGISGPPVEDATPVGG